jgi:hypothetical protein
VALLPLIAIGLAVAAVLVPVILMRRVVHRDSSRRGSASSVPRLAGMLDFNNAGEERS